MTTVREITALTAHRVSPYDSPTHAAESPHVNNSTIIPRLDVSSPTGRASIVPPPGRGSLSEDERAPFYTPPSTTKTSKFPLDKCFTRASNSFDDQNRLRQAPDGTIFGAYAQPDAARSIYEETMAKEEGDSSLRERLGKWMEKDPDAHSIQEHHEEPSDTRWYCEDRPLGTLTDLTRYQGCVNRLGALADPDRPVFQIFGSDIIKNCWIFGSTTPAEAFEMECLIRSRETSIPENGNLLETTQRTRAEDNLSYVYRGHLPGGSKWSVLLTSSETISGAPPSTKRRPLPVLDRPTLPKHLGVSDG